MEHITIFTHQLHEKLRLLVGLQANSRLRFRRCSTIWPPRLVTIVSEKLYIRDRGEYPTLTIPCTKALRKVQKERS